MVVLSGYKIEKNYLLYFSQTYLIFMGKAYIMLHLGFMQINGSIKKNLRSKQWCMHCASSAPNSKTKAMSLLLKEESREQGYRANQRIIGYLVFKIFRANFSMAGYSFMISEDKMIH